MPAIISHSLKLIFCHVPRTGGTSLFELMKPYFGEYTMEPQLEHHQSMRVLKKGFPKEWEEYISLAMIRHPFERFSSLHQGYSPKCTLPEMIAEIYSGRLDIKTYAFYWPMARWLCNEEGELLVNKVFKLEDGHVAVTRLLSELGAPVNFAGVQHLNKGRINDGDKSYYQQQRELCSRETMQMFEELYADDFDLFGYGRVLT